MTDENEWLHQITLAAHQGRDDDAQAALRQCLAEHPESGRAHYLMAADLAQSGDFERSLHHFYRAVTREPGLHEARLQWALLLLTLGRPAEALQVLAAFDGVALHPAVLHFVQGMQHIALGHEAQAIATLRAGQAYRHPNEPLMRDMAFLAQRLEAKSPAGPQAEAAAAEPDIDVSGDHFLVGAYQSASRH